MQSTMSSAGACGKPFKPVINRVSFALSIVMKHPNRP
jgi:hypothetical protein